MSRRVSSPLTSTLALLLLATSGTGCIAEQESPPPTAEPEPPPVVDPAQERGPDKADTTGSCAGSTCDGRNLAGTCWCDGDCVQYGDCCHDRRAVCEAAPPPPPSGHVDVPELGSDANRALTVVGTSADGLDGPRDLAFHPERANELWTVNLGFDGVVLFFGAGTSSQRAEVRRDSHADHFMSSVSAIAFGAPGTFGTAQESVNGGNGFMGPVLWSSDLDVFARENQEPSSPLLGSHLDMLHQSPLSMGLAWSGRGNGYWVFDGYHGHVVYYDFQHDHGPGYDDHSDGIVRFYPEARVTRRRGVPGHMELDAASGWLYVADPGGGRVIRLQTTTGMVAGSLRAQNEPLAEFSRISGADVETFATGLSQPSGVALRDTRLFVSDFATGDLVVFSTEGGQELGRLATGAQGIQGITFGPDGKLWYVDAVASTVVRIDP